MRKLSSNNYIRNEGKVPGSFMGHLGSRDQEPKTVNHDRKKHATNAYNPISNERQRTEETTTAGEFNRSTKMNMTKKPK